MDIAGFEIPTWMIIMLVVVVMGYLLFIRKKK